MQRTTIENSNGEGYKVINKINGDYLIASFKASNETEVELFSEETRETIKFNEVNGELYNEAYDIESLSPSETVVETPMGETIVENTPEVVSESIPVQIEAVEIVQTEEINPVTI